MTDARMPSRWLTDPALDILSDKAWRTFMAALMWSAENGTDGALPHNALRFLHPQGVDDVTAAEIITAKKWEKTAGGYQVLKWSDTQSLAEIVQAQREKNREHVKAWRQRKAAEMEAAIAAANQTVSPVVSPYVAPDESDHETSLSTRQGKGTGQALENQPPVVVSIEHGPTPTAGNPNCKVCGRPRLYSKESMTRGVCLGCVQKVAI